jgi:hypothetical protein
LQILTLLFIQLNAMIFWAHGIISFLEDNTMKVINYQELILQCSSLAKKSISTS